MRNNEGSEVQRVVRVVRHSIDLDSGELGDEFFPAHVSVALIDAVFTPQLRYYEQVVPIIERYCRRFGLRRLRADRSCLPPVEEQETLSNLIDHYRVLGLEGMQQVVVWARYRSPGTTVLKSENVRRTALALRSIGLATLQDAESTHPGEIKSVLRPLSGIGDRTIHMFLMYSGGDEFVKGDVHVCRFVANALGRRRVAPAGGGTARPTRCSCTWHHASASCLRDLEDGSDPRTPVNLRKGALQRNGGRKLAREPHVKAGAKKFLFGVSATAAIAIAASFGSGLIMAISTLLIAYQ